MTALKVGVVGSRFAAHLHLQAYRRVYGVDVRLAGVTSPTAERRKAFADESGATPYPDLAAMLPHVDVVDICSPPGKEALLQEALASSDRIVDAARRRGVVLAYAENWIYAPAVQKEREIVEKSGAQILWMLGGESHNGSHSPVYGIWRHAGGGSLIGKGCHPLTGCLYLKAVEGRVHNWLEVFANNHRTTCRLNPVNLLDTYNPEAGQFRDIYLVEKIGTKEGWSHPAADEEWQQGFYGEIQDFVECCVSGGRPQSDADVARDTVATLYAGYVSAERGGHEIPVPLR